MSFLQKTLSSVHGIIHLSKKTLGISLNLQPEKNIIRFCTAEDISNWISSSDRSIGGQSECSLSIANAVKAENSNQANDIVDAINDDDQPCAVFSGKLSLQCQPTQPDIVRSGYCAVRGSMPPHIMLHGYEGIKLRVKTDGRKYRMNIQMDSWNPFNLYMGFIHTPPNKWVDITLRFQDFLLTAKGYYKLYDETKLDPAKIKTIGFAIADQKEGDFELRVQHITALAELEGPGGDLSDEELFDEELQKGDTNPTGKRPVIQKPKDFSI